MSRILTVNDPVIAGLLGQLGRAKLLRHSQRPFLEHLLCTWRILADWRMPVAVCRAGFMHSAYSTSFYPHALFRLDERETVKRMIGSEAEELVFRFCTMDRRGFWDGLVRSRHVSPLTLPDRCSGTPVRVTRKTLGQLLVIESANIAEQRRAENGGPEPWMSRILGWWNFLEDRHIPLRLGVRPQLTSRADRAAVEAYRNSLKAPLDRATALLDRAIEQNPWAAEPRILRALGALELGNTALSENEAAAGADLISAWAVAWDKRLTVEGWKALADRIHMRASQRPSFESVCAILNGRAPKPRWLMV